MVTHIFVFHIFSPDSISFAVPMVAVPMVVTYMMIF